MFKQFKINAKDFDGPVLVTGAGGCIGSWALTLLSDAGIPVTSTGPSKSFALILNCLNTASSP